MNIQEILSKLGLEKQNSGTWIDNKSINTNDYIDSYSPADGRLIGSVNVTGNKEYETVISTAVKAQKEWAKYTAPQRGEIVRQYGNALREYKAELGALVSYEMGKSYQEGLGEVQEMIDICDFAVGLSRQLYGLTMHSERPQHRMYEQWHPLGVVGIISAFNFPVAVWAWNTALAWVCGNVTIWKGSEKTPLCSVACQKIWNDIATENNLPEGISNIITGDFKVGEMMTTDKRVNLVSATGSTRMGREVQRVVGERFGKTLLELGGNNALIVSDKADLKLAIPAIVFGAVGTCGQRCTSTRRIIAHKSIKSKLIENIKSAYQQIKIGNPLDENNHVGPLIDEQAVANYNNTIKQALEQGGKILVEGGMVDGAETNCYVKPCVIEIAHDAQIVHHETFAPILYVLEYSELPEALAIQNEVPQGLSSAIFTESMKEMEYFLSHAGSDCGIANVNIGTSGAEIGGAFGGEKETGGGRESGSDAWRAYMRRQTNTINYSDELPLAQGIKFNL